MVPICLLASLVATGPPPPPAAATGGTPSITYAADVAAIIDRRCVGCHRRGEVGPFGLETYREVARRSASLADAIETGRMPPWHADPGHGTFANDPRPTDAERARILRWVALGCPPGDLAALPRPIDHPTGWRIGPPDLVVAMPASFAVPADGVLDYQFFEVDPGFAADRWVRAAEVRPGNRRVVHHATVFLQPPGGRGPGTQGELGSFCLATFTPGTEPLSLPAGMAKRIPAGWRLVFALHYAPIGSPQVDRTALGLAFADEASVRREVATNLLVAPDLRIPPHVADHRVERSRRFEADVLLLSMFPHMHARGRSFRYDAAFPDGRIETLLHVPRYDFAWQDRYVLAAPRRLPAGTTLRCVATYDNSAANPANPDPTATVRAGQQGRDEMFNGYYEIALADQDLARAAGPVGAASAWAATAGLAGALLLIRRRSRASTPRARA